MPFMAVAKSEAIIFNDTKQLEKGVLLRHLDKGEVVDLLSGFIAWGDRCR